MFVLYVLEGCPYCERAKELLRSESCKYETVVIPNDMKIKSQYKKRYGMNSFPMIFVERERNHYLKLGGYNDLEEYIEIAKNIKNTHLAIDNLYAVYENMYSRK